MKMTGVILSGGKSSRFGSPKAFAKREGQSFYQYSINALNLFCDEIFIVTSKEMINDYKEVQNVKLIVDQKRYAGLGPLAGIYTAMDHNHNHEAWYAVLPTDVPFVNGTIFTTLIKYNNPPIEAVVPVVSNKKQPLMALYHQSIKNKIEHSLECEEYSIMNLLSNLNVKYVSFLTETPFLNINDKKTFNRYIK